MSLYARTLFFFLKESKPFFFFSLFPTLYTMSDSPVILITGASKGIGKSATLEALEKFNARVVVIARSKELLEQLASDITTSLNKGHQFEYVVGDVTDEKVLRKAVNVAVDKWGRLDSVIANAG